MLTVDEQFEAIIAGAEITAKMGPVREPDPKESSPSEEPDEAPEEQKQAEGE